MNLNTYRTLGRSGLIVSPLALGTMTFGTQRWGSLLAIVASAIRRLKAINLLSVH